MGINTIAVPYFYGMETAHTQILGYDFILHPSGVCYWEQTQWLLISDVHLGKVSHFRKHGAAVPQNAIQKNFTTMDAAVAHFSPKKIIFMGDLFHSAKNQEWVFFKEWTKRQSAKLVLVSGNHDIISPLAYENLGVAVVEELQEQGFLLTHHPDAREPYFNICGHIHPAIRLTGFGRQSVRLRCFYKAKKQLILPAFGAFTGNHTLEATEGCAIFALLGDAVIPVALSEPKRRKRKG